MSSSSQSQSSHGGNRYNIGRKQDPVRLNYVKVDKAHMRCKTCNNIVTNKVERLRAHEEKGCSPSLQPTRDTPNIQTPSTPSSPSNINPTLETPLLQSSSSLLSNHASSQSSSVPYPSGSPQQPPLSNTTAVGSKRKSQTQAKIDPIRTSKEYREACAIQLSKFFYSARLPFLECENEEFKAFQEMLRPGITTTPLVTRKSLAGKYLDQEHNQIQLASKVG